jgi:23S rRNA (adenine2503-C2)-methyltransferase
MAGVLDFERSEAASINEVVYFRTADGYEISTACATEPVTWICVSSQAGCVIGCPFCATTGKGFYRSLTGEEIAHQIAFVAGRQTAALKKIHFGGIGEPLMNLRGIADARRLTVAADVPGVLPTTLWEVTTSAYAPAKLPDLFAQDWWSTISVSLHSCIPELREELIPRAKPLGQLREQLLALPPEQERRLVFNYLLLSGINDDDANLRALIEFLEPFSPHHVLLMRVADVGRGFWTDEDRLEEFALALEERRAPVELATPSRHQKIGGCGTLKVEAHQPQKSLTVVSA